MYRKLRGKFKELDIDQKYLARLFGFSVPSISCRMTRKTPWRLDEMYQIMDLIKEPHSRLHEFFPKQG